MKSFRFVLEKGGFVVLVVLLMMLMSCTLHSSSQLHTISFKYLKRETRFRSKVKQRCSVSINFCLAFLVNHYFWISNVQVYPPTEQGFLPAKSLYHQIDRFLWLTTSRPWSPPEISIYPRGICPADRIINTWALCLLPLGANQLFVQVVCSDRSQTIVCVPPQTTTPVFTATSACRARSLIPQKYCAI